MAEKSAPIGNSRNTLECESIFKSKEKIWRAVLEKISDHNGPLEVTPCGGADPEVINPIIRSRLIRFDKKGMAIERPDDIDDRRALRSGTRVELLIVEGNQRWNVQTKVTGIGKHALNDRMSIETIELASPSKVTSAQRRDHFRVSIAGARLEPVMLHPMNQPETDDGVPVDGVSTDPFPVTMVNLGGGGVGVRVAPERASQGKYFTQYQAVLHLPVENGGLSIPANAVYREESTDGSLYLGLQFEFDGAAMRRQCEDVICHFTSEVQRQQLARQRGSS